MFSMERFHHRYDTFIVPVAVNGHTLNLYKPASIDRFIEPNDLMANFPLWAKLWEASGVLASYLCGLSPDPLKTMLEIGCGLGMAGIAAAKAGHRVTMTEINPDALNFARANALENDCPNMAVERLDWNAPDLTGQFDYVVGSETVYKSEDLNSLDALFSRYLKPDGVIILTAKVRQTSVDFWERMRHQYTIQAQRQTLRSDEDTQHVVLFRLQRKPS